jgi:transposase
MTYVIGVRQAVLRLLASTSLSMRKIAAAFAIGASTVSRWARHGIMVKKRVFGSKLTSDMVQTIKTILLREPCLGLRPLRSRIFDIFGVRISKGLASAAIRKAGLTRKRARLQFTPKSAEVLNGLREAFCEAVASYRGKMIVFVDESGFSLRSASPPCGYAPKGMPLRISSKPPMGKAISMVAAISNFGFRCCMTQTSPFNSACFASFLSTAGIPKGSIIVMDNAAIHSTRHVQGVISGLCCEALFIPPYSPEFNAIKNIFGIMKRRMLQSNAAFTERGVGEAFAGIDPDVVLRTSAHCLREFWRINVSHTVI